MPFPLHRVSARALLVAGTLLLGACERNSSGPDEDVFSITVDPASISLTTGAQQSLTAQVRDDNGNLLPGVAVRWASSDNALATVDTAGAVTALAPGEVEITATAAGKQGSSRVVVSPAPPQVGRIRLSASVPIQMKQGGSDSVSVSLYAPGVGATPQLPARPATWRSTDSLVATVTPDGTGVNAVVRGQGAGTAYVVAAVDGVKDSVAVKVFGPPSSVTLSRSAATILVGDTARFAVTIRDATGSTYPTGIARESVAWTSSDLGKATVTPRLDVHAAAFVSALSPGVVTITATAGSQSATAQVTILPAVASVEVSPGSVTLAPGGTHSFTATAQDAGGNVIPGVPVTWSVSDLSLLMVSAQGTVTAHAAGTATVLATVHGKTGSATVTVTGTPPTGPAMWQSITSGSSHTCAIAQSGRAYCWGANNVGQLGNGTQTASNVPREVAGGLRFVQLSAGSQHSCGIATDGDTYCWGNLLQSASDSPAKVNAPVKFTSLSSGRGQTCALTADGTPYCWGSGARTASKDPVPPPVGSKKFTMLAAGNDASCGLENDGAVTCWIGIGWQSYPLGASFQVIDASTTEQGTGFVCGLSATGEVSCTTSWSAGVGGTVFVSGFRVLPGAPAMRQISVGGERACGLDASGGVVCWPRRASSTDNFGYVFGDPVRTEGPAFAQLNVGNRHSCALTAAGVAYCWGDNTSGQLGVGTTGGTSTGPARVANPAEGGS